MKIFFSHSSTDKNIVRKIRDLLPPTLNAWIDENEILAGDDFQNSILKAIKKDCSFLVVFISNNSIKSDWVKLELKHGLKKEKELNRTFIIPVLLNGVDISNFDKLGFGSFKNKHYLSIEENKDFEQFVKKLYENLFSHLVEFLNKTEKKISKEKETWEWNIYGDTFDSIIDFSQEMPEKYLNWISDFIEYIKNLQGTPCEFQIQKIQEKTTYKIKEWRTKANSTKKKLDDNKGEGNIGLMIYLVGILETEENIVKLFEFIELTIEKYKNGFLNCDKTLSLIYNKLNL